VDDDDRALLDIALAATDALKRRVRDRGDRIVLDAVNDAVVALHDVCRAAERAELTPLQSAGGCRTGRV
jgi:hypothetical protein